MKQPSLLRMAWLAGATALSLGLAACSDGGGSNDSGATFELGGTVSGLANGATVTLVNNGNASGAVTVGNGAFAFASELAGGANYAVTVSADPDGVTCTVSNGSGAVASSDVSTVAVACAANAARTVGGTITGLADGGALQLQLNGAAAHAIVANGAFTLAASVLEELPYAVRVAVQPAGQLCVVSNGNGTAAGANIDNVSVSCGSTTMFAYVADFTADHLLRYVFDGTNGTVGAPTTLPSSAGPVELNATNNGAFIVSANRTARTVSVYRTNTATGALTSIGELGTTDQVLDAVVSGNLVAAVTSDRPGASDAINRLLTYKIDPVANTVAPADTRSLPSGGYASGVAISPLGLNIVATIAGADRIASFAVTGQGILTEVAGSPFAGGTGPEAVKFHPSGSLILVPNRGGGDVSVYKVAGTGALTEAPGSPFSTGGSEPWSIALEPSGAWAYVTNRGSHSLAAFDVNATTGALTLKGTPISTNTQPEGVAIDRSGTFALVANRASNNVTIYRIDNAGDLSPTSSFTTTLEPTAITFIGP